MHCSLRMAEAIVRHTLLHSLCKSSRQPSQPHPTRILCDIRCIPNQVSRTALLQAREGEIGRRRQPLIARAVGPLPALTLQRVPKLTQVHSDHALTT